MSAIYFKLELLCRVSRSKFEFLGNGGWLRILGMAAFMAVLCRVLNGSEYNHHSDEKYAKSRPEHQKEQWVSLN